MLDLETRIALASMTHIVNLDAYDLLLGRGKIFNDVVVICVG